MSQPKDGSPEETPGAGGEETPQAELAPFKIEGARSSRSACKACRRKIEQGTLRLGVLIQGPFGTGYLWFHLKCAARRRMEDVEEAYNLRVWAEGLEVPPLEELRRYSDESREAKEERREAPYAERSPSGRAKCKQCGVAILQGALRVVVLRSVQFGNQVRNGPITVHPRCVRAALGAPDSATQAEGLGEALRNNSGGLDSAEVERALSEIGPLR